MQIHQHVITITLRVATLTDSKVADTTSRLVEKATELGMNVAQNLGHHMAQHAVRFDCVDVVAIPVTEA